MKDSDALALVRRLRLLALMGALFSATRALCVTDPTVDIKLTHSKEALVLQWGSLTSVPYQVESSSNLLSWVGIDSVRIGTGGDLFSTNAITSALQRYFRVRRAFPAAAGSAVFDPATRVLTVVGDAQHTTLTIAPDANGIFQVNSGAIPIKGGIASNSITVLVQVLGTTGDDVISVNSGLIPAHIFGDSGKDTLSGSSGNDLIVGGPGADVVTGGRGNDTLFLEDGDDSVIWNPGDGSDTIEGGLGTDSLVFNGANINEIFTISANGSHAILSRNVAAITMDLHGIETVNLHMLGGADIVNVDPLGTTELKVIHVDCSAVLNGNVGDAQADTLFVNGTAGPDVFHADGLGGATEVVFQGVSFRMLNAEPANDRIALVGVGGDTVNVDGTPGADTLQVTPSPIAGFVRATASGFTVPVDVNGSLTLALNGLGGPDTLTGGNGLSGSGIPLVFNGGDGKDVITGSDGNDTINGGADDDIITGGRGTDAISGGTSNDTVIWNPGDGSDSVDGGSGNDTLQFNGANISEIVALSSSGTGARLTRNIGAITLELSGVENVNLQMLGGADSIAVGNLFKTGVTAVNVDLAATLGGVSGDAQADTVSVDGGSGSGIVHVSADGTDMVVAKDFMKVRIKNGELGIDRLAIVGDPTDSVSVDGTTGPDTMQVSPSPVAGSVRVISNGYAMPVDVASAAKVTVSGLAGTDILTGANGLAALAIPLVFDGGPGDDTITGGDGNETLIGGDNNDTLTGARGNDTLLMGSGNDTAVWNPGDGNDVIEGQGGSNTLVFNGSNIGEDFVFNANGTRLQLLRNIANISLDLNGVQIVNVQALGGADNITVNALAATGLSQLNIDLASTIGGASGDGQADKITLNGTAGVDAFSVSAALKVVKVTGVGPQVSIRGAEKATDSLILNGLGGDDTFLIGPGVSTEITVTPGQVLKIIWYF